MQLDIIFILYIFTLVLTIAITCEFGVAPIILFLISRFYQLLALYVVFLIVFSIAMLLRPIEVSFQHPASLVQSNPVNTVTEGAIDSVRIKGVSVLVKVYGFSFPLDKAICP